MSKKNPIVEQGKAAREAKLGPEACPYSAEGDNRNAWFDGYGPGDASDEGDAAEADA